ncbi:hypothetical protein V3564_04875 [Bartonella sp. B12(2025)]
MPLLHHTHKLMIEPATKEEVKEGILDDKVLAPTSVGSAAAYQVEYFASAAQGKKADEAVAKRDIGALAYKDKATIYDIEAKGDPSKNTVLSGVGWVNPSSLGVGDMNAAAYDPDNVKSNAFSMENMTEGVTKKILTKEERLKLQWLTPVQPTIEKWYMGDEGANYPISPCDLKETISYFALSKSVYDPNQIEKDAFDMDNMKEGKKHFILTSQERTLIAKIDTIEKNVQEGGHAIGEAKDIANLALSTAKDAQDHAVEAKDVAVTAQTTANTVKAVADVAQTKADKAQETADKVQKEIDLIQPLEKQDWIDGTKTVDALISPANLMASIKANNDSSGGGNSKPLEILITESGEIPWPEGVTGETELEIWAWGGGNAGDSFYDGSGGAGGCCAYVRTKKKFLGNNPSVRIGKGGVASGNKNGESTQVGNFIKALGGAGKHPYGGVDGALGYRGETVGSFGGRGGKGFMGGKGGNGGRGGDGGIGGDGGDGGENFLSNGGRGGDGGKSGSRSDGDGGSGGAGGYGGDSIYGCGGCGGKGGDGTKGGRDASGNWSGLGGHGGAGGYGGNSVYGGGGGGGPYGRGSDGTDGKAFGGFGGRGGNSVYGGGGGGGCTDIRFFRSLGGHSMWGGNGGDGGYEICHGGGGGYFPGKDATSSSGGDGGDGAVLIKVYL